MKQQTKGGVLHKLWQSLPWLWMAAAYLTDLWYQLVPGRWIVDSDLASEMILADLLNREGSVISHNWFYSTELKVVNLQWFYRLGLLLFPDDWHLARTFGMAIALALYAAAMLFFVKCAGLGRPGLWMVGTLLWPFGQHYLVYAIYGGYYLVYTFFYMLVLALVLRSLTADKKHCALQWLLACLITAVAGMNGVKQLMVFHAPLCLAAAVLLVMALHGSSAELPQGGSSAGSLCRDGGGQCGGLLRQQCGAVPPVRLQILQFHHMGPGRKLVYAGPDSDGLLP